MRKRIVVLAALASLIGPGVAGAHAHRAPLSIALERAYQLWHVKPCDGRYRVELVMPPLADGVAAWAGNTTWDSPTGANEYTSPPSTWTNCVMQLRAAEWSSRQQVDLNWPQLCTVVLHEWGHLTGHPHSDEPGAPPEPPGMTAEQLAIMRSGEGYYASDTTRCGWAP